MVRLTGQEMTATEKILCFSQFPRGGASSWAHGEAPGLVQRPSSWEICARMFIMVFTGEKGEAVKQAWD